MAQLRNPDGAGDIPQAVAAEVGQPGLAGKLIVDHFLCGGGDYRLAAVRQVAQASRFVDRRSGVVALVPQLHIAGMQPDAQLDGSQIRPLQRQRACDGVAGPGERCDETVAFPLFDRTHPVVFRDDPRGGLIHPRDRGCHGPGLGCPQPRRTFDIGEQQRHRADGEQLAHVQVTFLGRAHASQLLGPAGLITSAQRRISPSRGSYSEIRPRADGVICILGHS
jgi:hypothetical protein